MRDAGGDSLRPDELEHIKRGHIRLYAGYIEEILETFKNKNLEDGNRINSLRCENKNLSERFAAASQQLKIRASAPAPAPVRMQPQVRALTGKMHKRFHRDGICDGFVVINGSKFKCMAPTFEDELFCPGHEEIEEELASAPASASAGAYASALASAPAGAK